MVGAAILAAIGVAIGRKTVELSPGREYCVRQK